jgi:hypothetical protein
MNEIDALELMGAALWTVIIAPAPAGGSCRDGRGGRHRIASSADSSARGHINVCSEDYRDFHCAYNWRAFPWQPNLYPHGADLFTD